MKKILILVFIVSMFSFSCKKINPLGYDVIVDEDIAASTTWTKNKIYFIQGTVRIENNVVLTIEPGTVIKFDKDAEFDVGSSSYGTVIAKGTADDPIIFTSNATVKAKGDWYGVYLYDGANNCEFEYCTFEYGGGYSVSDGVMNLSETNASFKNCTFSQSKYYGVHAEDAGFDAFSNNTFSNCDLNPIYIYPEFVNEIGAGNVYDGGTIDVEQGYLEKTGTVVWSNQGIPYKILGTLNVGSPSGTILSIAPGTTLAFTHDAELGVGNNGEYGDLVCEGTSTDHVIFTSSAASPTNGDWYGIYFYDGTGSASNFDYFDISYGGGYGSDGNFNLYDITTVHVTISNTSSNHSAGYGIYVYSGQATPVLSNVTYNANTLGTYYVQP